MKQVVEVYVGIWVIVFMFLFAMAFTSINLNVSQARKVMSDIKAEIQASNGSILGGKGFYHGESANTLQNSGYYFEYLIQEQDIASNADSLASETYIYNKIYKIRLEYEYWVPLFGKQLYPIESFAY